MSDNNLSIYQRYWIFSKTEADRFKKIAEGMSGKTNYEFGRVFTNNGVAKNYTSIVTDLSKLTAPDSVVVMEGDIRKVNFKPPVLY